jgi:hypothetical protein
VNGTLHALNVALMLMGAHGSPSLVLWLAEPSWEGAWIVYTSPGSHLAAVARYDTWPYVLHPDPASLN